MGEYDPESCGTKENWKHFAKNHWKTDDIVNDRDIKFDECVFIKFKSGKQTIISTFNCCDIVDAKNTVFKNIFDL